MQARHGSHTDRHRTISCCGAAAPVPLAALSPALLLCPLPGRRFSECTMVTRSGGTAPASQCSEGGGDGAGYNSESTTSPARHSALKSTSIWSLAPVSYARGCCASAGRGKLWLCYGDWESREAPAAGHTHSHATVSIPFLHDHSSCNGTTHRTWTSVPWSASCCGSASMAHAMYVTLLMCPFMSMSARRAACGGPGF
jgi:hypothetical protein